MVTIETRRLTWVMATVCAMVLGVLPLPMPFSALADKPTRDLATLAGSHDMVRTYSSGLDATIGL